MIFIVYSSFSVKKTEQKTPALAKECWGEKRSAPFMMVIYI